MSKLTKRKITVESTTGSKQTNPSNSNINKDFQRRQSVFERLGTKTGASISINTSLQPSGPEGFCRHWNQNGTCPYGKSCVFVSTHTLISPSKRALKKDSDPKQGRIIEENLKLEGLKRLHSTVVKRGSPELNWESWDHSELEYEDEKALEKRRQLLQRELELQMKREETEEHHSRRRHNNTTHKKVKPEKNGVSSSSSTSVSSTSSESSSSSDDTSSDSSSTSGVAGDSKRRRSKIKKSKRASASSASDTDRKKPREAIKSMHKDRSPSSISRKSASSKDKRAFTPPRKPNLSVKVATRKKSPSPNHRRHNTPTTTSSTSKKPSSSKTSTTSRHNPSPRPSSKRSTSLERKDKHKSSLSPRARSKQNTKERSPPRRPDPRPRRKDSPDTKPRNASRSRLTESRLDDRKKDDDRSRNKDDRRSDRKPVIDRDKRDHEDNRSREKAREAAREKEREEALERCRERQREREQLAKEKERTRERERDNRDKEVPKSREARDYEKNIPPLMSLSTHNQSDRKIPERERDRTNKDRKDREKDRDKDKERDRDRLYDRNIDKTDRNRPLDKERISDKISDRDRGGDKDRPRDRDSLTDRSRDKADKDRNFDRDRNYDRNTLDPPERAFDREKDNRVPKVERNRDRDFDREKERNFDRAPDNRRSFDKAGDRDRTSLEKDRGIVRDRAIERVLELRERNKSLERGRASDGERSVDRNRDRFEREGRFDRRTIPPEEKAFDPQFEPRRDRTRYGGDSQERGTMFKDLSPAREEARGMRHPQTFNEDRRMRGGREMRGGWEGRGTYEESGPGKTRDWDYSESRREWDARSRHTEWEGGVEGDEWGRYGSGEWEGDWREEWQHRPPRHGPRDDQTIVLSNHIVVTNIDDSSGRRSQAMDPSDKDMSGGDFKKDNIEIGSVLSDGGGHKRAREENEVVGPGDAKKPRQEEPSQLLTANLEEVLSDISDDPDEILNREDIDVPVQETGPLDVEMRRSPPSIQASAQELDNRLLEDRPNEDDNIANLNDFEEISDEELEEEARANKGLGDALGVDWASLVTESRPKAAESQPGAARRRWQPYNILARIGVSLQYAGQEAFDQIQQKLTENKEGDTEEKKEENSGLLHPVAALHMSMRERKARRRCLFAASDVYKRALSARADIAIRRQLCNLPVASLEMQQSAGFCQWVV